MSIQSFLLNACRYCSRTDCGCMYKLTVSLLDEGQEIITEFKPDEVTLDPDCDDCSWRKVRVLQNLSPVQFDLIHSLKSFKEMNRKIENKVT